MKTVRTKVQEIVNELFDFGVYVVRDEDLDRVVAHFDSVFRDLLDSEYADALVKYLRGETLDQMDGQRKFHGLANLKVSIGLHPEATPTFLPKAMYPAKKWYLADLGEVLYGVRGDPKVYHLDLPAPENGRYYNVAEVKSIVEQMNT